MIGSRLPAVHLLAAFFATFALGLGAPPRCSAQTFVGLKTAGSYGLFEGGGNGTLTLGSGDSGTTNAAFAASSKFSASSTGSFTGTLYADPSSGSYTNTGPYTFSGNSGTPPSPVVTSLTQAVTDAQAAVTSASGLTPTQTFSGGISVANNGSTTITGTPGQNVIQLGGDFQLGSNATLNISGTASETFIFVSSHNLNFNNAGISVDLLGGVTANHVIFVFNSASVGANGAASTFNGTILSMNGDINFTNGTLNGALIQAGGHNLNFSGTTIHAMPYQTVPEPGSLLLGSIMAVVCGSVHYYQRRKRAA